MCWLHGLMRACFWGSLAHLACFVRGASGCAHSTVCPRALRCSLMSTGLLRVEPLHPWGAAAVHGLCALCHALTPRPLRPFYICVLACCAQPPPSMAAALKDCEANLAASSASPDAPVVVYVSKMIAVPATLLPRCVLCSLPACTHVCALHVCFCVCMHFVCMCAFAKGPLLCPASHFSFPRRHAPLVLVFEHHLSRVFEHHLS